MAARRLRVVALLSHLVHADLVRFNLVAKLANTRALALWPRCLSQWAATATSMVANILAQRLVHHIVANPSFPSRVRRVIARLWYHGADITARLAMSVVFQSHAWI